MRKKTDVLDLTTKQPLIERQRRLYAHAEAIELAQHRKQPLPESVSEWLHRALKKIACGEDANKAFNVVPERGVRRNLFRQELEQKMINGYIAAATEQTTDGSEKKKTVQARKEISEALPVKQESTVRRNWNKASTDRKPTFTFGKK
jgi:hypothetical protein